MQYIRTAIVLLFFISIVSCSSSNNCNENNYFQIDYYSGGGFTGIEQGLTIACDGSALFWNRKLNSERKISDSIEISSEQLKTFNDIIMDPELLSYHHEFAGNYTYYLTITINKNKNSISFSPDSLPNNIPSSVKQLLSEIKKIKTN